MEKDLIEIAIGFGFPLALIVVALFAGRAIERKHYRSIRERERQTLGLPAVPSRAWDPARPVAEVRLVCGSVVLSADYFRSFLAGLRNIIGGRLISFESMMDRGRREAILRMKEQFPEADIIVNLRLETSTIGAQQAGRGSNQLGTVELFAYGTAIRYADGRGA